MSMENINDNEKMKGMPDGITIIENYLGSNIREEILNFARSAEGKRVTVGEITDTKEVKLKEYSGYDAERVELGELYPIITPLFKRLYEETAKKYLGTEALWYEYPHVLRYGKNGHYVQHSDSENWNPETKQWERGIDRDISAIMYLNDDFEGGALSFPIHNVKIQPRAGMLVMFPSDHRFIHAAEPTTAGKRYALVTWAAAKNVPRVCEWPKTRVILL